MAKKVRPLSPKQQLNCDLTRIIDDSTSVSYEDVIELLQKQIKWMRKARRIEFGK